MKAYLRRKLKSAVSTRIIRYRIAYRNNRSILKLMPSAAAAIVPVVRRPCVGMLEALEMKCLRRRQARMRYRDFLHR